MEQPEGYSTGKNMVWKLMKSLYGLKQSPRAWYRELDLYLCQLGFVRFKSDHSIYTRDGPDGLIIVGVYVDDLTIAAAQKSTLHQFKLDMASKYDMKDLGELHFILGLQVKRDRASRTLQLCQTSYINSILARFDLETCKPAKSPLPAKVVLKARLIHEPKADMALYLAGVGSLMYAMLGTRPDIAFAVGLLGRFARDPSVTHWEAVCHVFRYLAHTQHLALTYSPGSNKLEAFSDAEYATSDPDTRRSVCGYVITLWGGAISWQSKRQPSIALATGDAEYMGLAQTAREVIWLRSLLLELGQEQNGPTLLNGDNKASIALAQNPVAHTRSKQIDIRFHYLREVVERGIMKIGYVPTLSMIADGLTKPLPPITISRSLASLGLVVFQHLEIKALVCRIIPHFRALGDVIVEATTSLAEVMTSHDVILEAATSSENDVIVDVEGYKEAARALDLSSLLYHCNFNLDLELHLHHKQLELIPSIMPSAAAQAQIGRADFVREKGLQARPGCTACATLVRPCIILPPTNKRPLNKCYHCTLNKQECSIDRIKKNNGYLAQLLVRLAVSPSPELDLVPTPQLDVVPSPEQDGGEIPWSVTPPKEMDLDPFDGISTPSPVLELPGPFDLIMGSSTSTSSSTSASPVDLAIAAIDKSIGSLKRTIKELERSRNGLVVSKGPLAIRSSTSDISP